jgi:hypothetical protein
VPETPATTSRETTIFPPGRYGRRREARRTPRWLGVVAAVCLAGAATLVGVNLYRAYGDGDYSYSVTGFTDITDNQVVVTFLVRLPREGKAVCAVRARDSTGAETGREEITVTPGPDPGRTVVTHRLITRTRPITGEVKGCRPA